MKDIKDQGTRLWYKLCKHNCIYFYITFNIYLKSPSCSQSLSSKFYKVTKISISPVNMTLCVMHMSLWNTFTAAKVYYNYSRFKHILCGVLLAVCLISSSNNHYNLTRTNQQSAASRLNHPDIFSRAAQLLKKKNSVLSLLGNAAQIGFDSWKRSDS